MVMEGRGNLESHKSVRIVTVSCYPLKIKFFLSYLTLPYQSAIKAAYKKFLTIQGAFDCPGIGIHTMVTRNRHERFLELLACKMALKLSCITERL